MDHLVLIRDGECTAPVPPSQSASKHMCLIVADVLRLIPLTPSNGVHHCHCESNFGGIKKDARFRIGTELRALLAQVVVRACCGGDLMDEVLKDAGSCFSKRMQKHAKGIV